MEVVKWIVLVVAFFVGTAVDSRNPGFKARITSNGLNYANKVAIQALKKSVETTRIPDQSGKASGFKYTVSNIRVTSFVPPNSAILIVPKQGLKWKGSGASMSVAGNFHYKSWFASDGGTFTATLSGVYFSLGIGMGMDKNGRPNIAAQSCDSGVGGVSFKFHGGMAWLYNLFRSKVGDKIRSSINKQLCPLINNEINVDAESKLAKLPVTAVLAHKFLLDYRLTQNPTFTASYMETYHKGEIFWSSKPTTEAPMAAPAMPESPDADRMMYLWLSDYVFDTIGYVAQTNGYLVYNLTAAELPPSRKGALDTTCSGFIPKCIGKLIPEIGNKYPNTHVDLHMRSNVAPTMKITPSGISVKCGGNLTMYVKATTGMVYLATLNATMLADVSVSITNEILYASVTDLEFTLGVVKSDIGPINTDVLEFIINDVLKPGLVQTLNDLGSKGFPLPVTEIRFTNTKLTLLQDAILIATDLSYSPGGFLQKEMNEIHGLVYKPNSKPLPVGTDYKLHNHL